MCKAFKNIGYHVEMVSLVGDEAVGKESREGSAYQLLASLPGFIYEFLEIGYNLLGIWRLWCAVRRVNPQFIYERYSIYNVAGAVVSSLTGVPLIEEVNAPLAFEKKKYGSLYFPNFAQCIETWIMNHSFKTITVTHALKKILIKNGAISKKIVVMPNGVNLEEYQNIASDKTKYDALTIGFIGWFRNWHGLKKVIETIGQKKWTEKNVRLLLVGDGPSRKEIEASVIKAGISNFVAITGAVDRQTVRHRLQEMDIALQPAATSYASPMKLIEYMAAGKAIVAPDQPNIRELLQHEKNALLFRPKDWSDFARQVERLISDPELSKNIGKAARESVHKRPLSWKYNAERAAALVK